MKHLTKKIISIIIGVLLLVLLMPTNVMAVEDNNFSLTPENSLVNVNRGGDAVLRVIPHGNDISEVTYRWYHIIENYDGYFDIALIDDENSDRLIFKDVQFGGMYFCNAKDKYGNTKDVYFKISVNDNKLRVSAPYEINIAYGDNIAISVTATAVDLEGLAYEWFYNGELIENEKSNTLTLANVIRSGQYQCFVTDKYGNRVSSKTNVVIDNNFNIKYPNQIKVNPNENASIKIVATANDTSGITYKWSKSDSDLDERKDLAEMGDTLILENVSKSETYYCDVTDKFGNIKNAWISVVVDNNFYCGGQQFYKVAYGEQVELKPIVTATDTEGLRYEWGKYVYNQSAGAEKRVIEGSNSAYLKVDVRENTLFFCNVIDKFNNRDSSSFDVQVDTGINNQPLQNVNARIGDSVVLKSNAAAKYGALHYQWYEVGKKPIEIVSTESTFFINNYDGENVKFECEITDDFGYSVFEIYSVMPLVEEHIEVGETKEIEANAGETAYLKFTPSVSGVYIIESNPSVYPNLQICDETKTTLESDNNYSRLRKYLEEGETYYISFENPRLVGPSSKASISLNVDETCDWIIEKETSTYYVDLGTKAELVPHIKGNTNNLTFKWYKFVEDEMYPGVMDSELIEGASDSTYITDEINYFTKYACFVEDNRGNFQSAYFDVYVKPFWTVDLSEKIVNVSAIVGETLNFNVPLSGNTTGLSYQWMVQGFKDYYMYYEEIEGANSNSYSTTANEYDRKYILVINDNYGNTERIEYNINIVTEKHELIKIAAKSPTMTSAGNIECYFCKDCNKHFKDANGSVELVENEWAIPALGASAIDDIANDETLDAGDVKSALSETFGESKLNESIKELLTSENTQTSEKTKEALAKLDKKIDSETVIENTTEQNSVKVENAIGIALNDAYKLVVGNADKETFELIKEQQVLKSIDIENGVPFSMELKNSKEESVTNLDIPMVIKLKIPKDVSMDGLRVIQIHGDETIVHVPQITMEEETLYATIVVTGFSDFMLANILPVQYIKGDVNNDGVIDAADVTALARHIANLSIITDKDILVYCCDTDGDGDVDAADVTHLARYIANLISEL